MKTSRGGKYSDTLLTSSNQGSRGRDSSNNEYDHVTYTFTDPKLGTVVLPGPRKVAIKTAEQLGYTEDDLKK